MLQSRRRSGIFKAKYGVLPLDRKPLECVSDLDATLKLKPVSVFFLHWDDRSATFNKGRVVEMHDFRRFPAKKGHFGSMFGGGGSKVTRKVQYRKWP